MADTVRYDPKDKITILGFLGIAPDVVIRCRRFPATLEIGFFLKCDTDVDHTHKLFIWISDSKGNVILPVAERSIQGLAGRPMNILFGTTAKYPEAGQYVMRIMDADRTAFYDVPFQVAPL